MIEEPVMRWLQPTMRPFARLAAHLRELASAGTDEAILVLDPITERSTRTVADAIVGLK